MNYPIDSKRFARIVCDKCGCPKKIAAFKYRSKVNMDKAARRIVGKICNVCRIKKLTTRNKVRDAFNRLEITVGQRKLLLARIDAAIAKRAARTASLSRKRMTALQRERREQARFGIRKPTAAERLRMFKDEAFALRFEAEQAAARAQYRQWYDRREEKRARLSAAVREAWIRTPASARAAARRERARDALPSSGVERAPDRERVITPSASAGVKALTPTEQ